MANRVPIKETVEIPTRGIIYGDMKVPAQWTIRAMTTLDEKARLSSTGMQAMPNLIKSCTIKPENIDPMDLKLVDIQYLMYRIRAITYGSDYKVSIKCPYCGESNDIVVDLDKIPVTYADESDKAEPFAIGPLPVSGDVLYTKLLTPRDYLAIDRDAKRLKSKNPGYIGDPEYILGYVYRIVSVNDEQLPPGEIQSYVESMHAKDTRYFDCRYSEISEGIGMDLNMVDTCKSCGQEFNFVTPTTGEFFRPRL